MNIDMKYMNELEVLINLFTIDKDGILKILLIRREMDPYRGYWMLPTSLLLSNECPKTCSYTNCNSGREKSLGNKFFK